MGERDARKRAGGTLGRRQTRAVVRCLALIAAVLVMVVLAHAQLANQAALAQDAPTATPRPLETLRALGQEKETEAGIDVQIAPTITVTATLPVTPGVALTDTLEAGTLEEGTPEPGPATPAGPGMQDAGTTVTDTEQGPEKGRVSPLDEVLVSRTPQPTATPDRIERAVRTLAVRAGLNWTQFLGVSLADWINIGVSAFWVLIGYLAGSVLINRILPAIARRTPYEIDDVLVQGVGPLVRWLVVVLVLDWSVQRLTLLDASLKVLLGDAFFVVEAVIAFRIVWRLIGLTEGWYRERAAEEGRDKEVAPMLVLMSRGAYTVVALISLSIVLSHLGINVTALATLLGVGGLAISLAAQDTIADAISGFIILADRPFRIGDRIEIQGVGTWGDVVEIGMRTTRIRTRDNRMVIIPNSIIGKNQVINYSYPDPRYRIETHVGVAYGTEIETVRRVITGAVRSIDSVLPDRPVDVLYHEMGPSAMVFRVRWWIESYADTRRVIDRVHTALQEALDAAGIECPYPTSTINLEVDAQTAERITQALR